MRWSATAAISVGATLLAWLLDAAGTEVPHWLSRLLVFWTVAWILFGLLSIVHRGLRSESAEVRLAMWALLALTAISFVARYVGLAFELTTHFHNDEGIFLKTAGKMLEGDLLPTEFHYPHLLYYLSALTLWIGGLFPAVTAKISVWGFGVAPQDSPALLLRLMTASLSALTTVPVFLAGRRIAGVWAGLFAGALIALSPTYNEVSHLAISDVPSGFFAGLTLLFVARLLDRETAGDYLLAGVAAALAAASKYPAGVCAVAIVGIWVVWRIRRRDFNALLIWSGLTSLATLLVVMPALWLRLGSVFGKPGDSDILFGYRQYAGKGWIGVVADSNVFYYAQGLAAAFGIVAVLLGTVGIFLLPRDRLRRTLALAIFPLVFLSLLIAMNVVVKRNMQPLLPAVAIVLGAGVSAWPPLMRRLGDHSKIALLSVLVLAEPAFHTVAWNVGRVRPGTRQLALEWIETNVPQGSSFVKEAYTPNLHPKRHSWIQSRYAARLTLDEIRDPRWDYLFLARNAHLRFLKPETRLYPHHEVYAERYERMFEEFELVERFRPGLFRSGPDLLLYRIDPQEPRFVEQRSFSLSEVTWVSDSALQPAGDATAITFFRKGQSVVFKEYFQPGEYRAAVNRQPDGVEGWLYVITRDNREVGQFPIFEAGSTGIVLDRADKYLLRVFLSPGGELRSLDLTPASSD